MFIILGEGKYLSVDMYFKTGQRGCRVLVVDDFSYNRNRHTDDKTYWICSRKVSHIFIRFLINSIVIFYQFTFFCREAQNVELVQLQNYLQMVKKLFTNHFYIIMNQKWIFVN